MPGITGFIWKNNPKESAQALDRMVKSMMHESFYSSAVYHDMKTGVHGAWIGHRGSFDDCMPLMNEARDIFMLFTGQNYIDQAEIDALRGRGHSFTPGDASYLLHLYEERGERFLEQLNGWFSGLLVDLRKKKTILFNDRYGLGRIYYHEQNGRFYFSSEAKALLKILPGLRKLDMTSLGEQFSCGCVLRNGSLFQGVNLLPPGSRWTFTPRNKVKKETYFDGESWKNQPPLAPDEYYRQLKETFARILPRYFQGREKMAVSLTGGVDSRMVMAWQKQPPGSFPCFTFGGTYRDCTDVTIARKVAQVCGQPHHILPVGREFLSRFPSLAERTVYLTDGAMDMTGTPDLFTGKTAREIAPVRMTGNYGGEILRSLVAFRPRGFQEQLLDPHFTGLVRATGATYRGELIGRACAFIAFKQIPWHHYSRMSLERSQITVRSPYLDNDLVAIAFRVPPELATSIQPALRLIADGNPKLAAIGTDRGLRYPELPLITKLNNLYQEFTFKAEYAYDYGMPQWIAAADHAFALLRLERLFLGRHKFYHFRVWYRDALAEYVKSILLDPRTLARPYLNGAMVEAAVRDHTSGRKNYTSEIHRLLTTELIERTLIEQG